MQHRLLRQKQYLRTSEEFCLRRDIFMYKFSYVRMDERKRVDKVEELFQEMKRGFERGETVLVAWLNSMRMDATAKAEMGLRQMFDPAEPVRFDWFFQP